MIVATAGHVDHGKTELIKALTGVDTDRLPEEKARGLSIDLGFAYQNPTPDTVVGYVDVPGHEKFVRNMLAGVGGIDLGLLVVAADDGVMPQTREHCAILDLLAIEDCLVAISKVDTVSESRVLEVHEQIESLLAQTRFFKSEVFYVCAPKQQGTAALKTAIELRLRAQDRAVSSAHFRLAVDRCFSLKGIGLVATGTVFAGEIGIDEQVIVSPRGLSGRVRGIRAHDQPATVARRGDRCALNLVGRGVSEASVQRGDWLVDEALHQPTDRIDVELRVLSSEERSLKHWTPIHVHHGASHITGRVAVLAGGSIEPGDSGLVQLVLDEPTTAAYSERLVIRDQSARRTVAGGRVIDPFSPKRGRARPQRLAWLEAIAEDDPATALKGLTHIAPGGLVVTQFARARNIKAEALESLVSALSLVRVGKGAEERMLEPANFAAIQGQLMNFVAEFHGRRGDQFGANLNDCRFGIEQHVTEDVAEHALRALVEDGRLGRRGQVFHLPGHEIRLSPQDKTLWSTVEPELAVEDRSPPSLQQAAETLGVDKRRLESFMKRAAKAGLVVQIARYRFITVETFDKLRGVVERLAVDHPDGFSVAQFRDASGLGRNFVIDLLEHFDRVGFTERIGNIRKLRGRST